MIKYNFLHIFFALPLILSGCNNLIDEINDDCLPEDIRQKFEQERDGGLTDEESDIPGVTASCEINVINSCILSNDCAFLIGLSGTSNGYKYFFTDKQHSKKEVRNKMKSLKYIEGTDYNLISTTYETNGQNLYLYLVGYSDTETFGPVCEVKFNSPNRTDFSKKYSDDYNEVIHIGVYPSNIIEFKLSLSDNYYLNYAVLADDEAEYVNGLAEAEAYLYVANYYDWGILDYQHTLTISIERYMYDKILFVTRAINTNGDQSRNIGRFYYYNVKSW